MLLWPPSPGPPALQSLQLKAMASRPVTGSEADRLLLTTWLTAYLLPGFELAKLTSRLTMCTKVGRARASRAMHCCASPTYPCDHTSHPRESSIMIMACSACMLSVWQSMPSLSQ